MKAEIFYPNIHLELNLIDFECILNNTEVSNSINMVNIGPLPVNYKWSFIIDENTIIEHFNAIKFTQKATLPSAENEIKPCENLELETDLVTNNDEIILNNDILIKKEENSKSDKATNIDATMHETLVSNSASDIMLVINQQNRDIVKKNLNQKLEKLILENNPLELPSYEEVI